MKQLSYSQMSVYLRCPLQYKLSYVDRLKAPPKHYFSFGSSIHSALEFLYKVKTPKPPSLDEFLKFYETNWEKEGYASPGQEKEYFEFGEEMLTGYYNIHTKDFKLPLSVEYNFNFEINKDVRLRGFIDRIDKLASGGVEVVDYKTEAEPFTTARLESDKQLTLYQIAIEKTLKLPVEKLTLYHMKSLTPFSAGPRTPSQEKEVLDLVVEVAGDINAGKFEPTLNNFCPCDFDRHCHYFRHKYMKEEGTEEGEGKGQPAGQEDMVSLVDDYSRLKEENKKGTTEIESLRGKIIGYMERNNLSRLFGQNYEVTLVQGEKQEWDEEDVKKTLLPAGLLDRVTGIDQSLVAGLLESDDTPPEIRQKLKSLRKLSKGSYQVRYKKIK
ncbi:MAG: PD-(D/E)XK nuclease family protein [Elusimicrobia bacterium]|nr:PD-(D/E)XK nuclease family protein [Elusimicrobiota bacterium]